MKIYDVIQGNPSILGSKKKGNEESGEVDFKKLLSEANTKLNKVNPGVSPPRSVEDSKILSNPISAVSSLNSFLELENLSEIRSKGIEAIEKTLMILEEYIKKMDNPEIPLKKIDQIIQFLNEEVDQLNTLSQKLAPSDPLQKILTEAGIVSTVEIAKFNRGEYI